MAHTFGRTILAHTSSVGNPISVGGVTVNAGETVLCLMLKVNGSSNRAGAAPTLGDYTFVQRNSTQKAAASPEASAELWDVLNPLPGTYTLTIPNTGALTIFYALVSAQARAGGHSDFDVAGGANATNTNPSPGAITTSEDGDAVFAVVASGADTWAPSGRAGTQINDTDDGTTGCGRQYTMQANRGAITMSWTFGTSDDYGAVVAAYKDVPPQTFNNYMRVGGAGMVGGG